MNRFRFSLPVARSLGILAALALVPVTPAVMLGVDGANNHTARTNGTGFGTRVGVGRDDAGTQALTSTAKTANDETTTWQNNVTADGGTTNTASALIDAYVSAGKAHGWWTHAQYILPFASDGFAGFNATLKTANHAPANAASTGFVAADYSLATGLKGANGKYLDTGWNYSTWSGGSVAGYAFFALDDSAFGGGPALGSITGTGGGMSGDLRLMFQDQYTPSVYNGRNFGQRFGAGSTRSLLHIERGSLSNGKFYVNGVNVGTDTGTMTSAPQNLTAKVFAIHNANPVAPDNFYVGHGGFFAITDGGMTDALAASFSADTKALITVLGRLPKSLNAARMALVVGQSLAQGSNSVTTLSTTQPYSNKQLVQSSGGQGFNPGPALYLTPLTEGITGAPESLGSGFANLQSALWRADHPNDASKDLIVTNYAVGGTPISYRNKSGGLVYNNSLGGISQAMAIAPDYYTGGFTVPYNVDVDGESDATSATYGSDLLQIQSDYQTDIQAQTGQSTPIPLLTSQISAWTSTGNLNAATALAPYQLLADYEQFPNRVVLVCPKYIFQYGTGANGVHLTEVGYRWLGEYYAKAADALNRGKTWSPLRPINVQRSGATITIKTTGGVGALVLDTSKVSNPGNYGFEWNQAGGTAQTIASVAVSGSDTVTIALSGDPGAPTTERVRYAYTGAAGNPGGPTTGPRGNLRDSDTIVVSLYGNDLSNWMVHFDKPIGYSEPSLPPVITSPTTAIATVGSVFSYQITATNLPNGFGATGLPAGLTFTPGTGMISGTPTQSGSFVATVSAANNIGTNTASLAFTVQTPFAGWQRLYFSASDLSNPAISGMNAMPAGDGITNLMKYALNLNPKTSGVSGLPTVSSTTLSGSRYLTLTYTKVLSAGDITYTPEVSSDMQTWSSGDSLATVSTTNNADGKTQTVIVADATSISSAVKRFVHLKVSTP